MNWISVNEKMYPQHYGEKFLAIAYEKCSECLCTKKHFCFFTLQVYRGHLCPLSPLKIHQAAVYKNDRGFYYVGSDTSGKELVVTHWMPLPKNPYHYRGCETCHTHEWLLEKI